MYSKIEEDETDEGNGRQYIKEIKQTQNKHTQTYHSSCTGNKSRQHNRFSRSYGYVLFIDFEIDRWAPKLIQDMFFTTSKCKQVHSKHKPINIFSNNINKNRLSQ